MAHINDTPAPLPTRFERLDRLEHWWLRFGTLMLIVFVSVVVVDALRNSQHHSHGVQKIAPDKLTQTPPFDNPGVFRNEDGSYTAVVVAYAFGWQPAEDLVVPLNTPVHFQVASLDVVHGLQIPGVSNVNLMVVPGYVSKVTQVFDEPGRHLVLCHEYCGSGHHFMVSHIRVLEEGQTVEDYNASAGSDKPDVGAQSNTDAAASAGDVDEDEHGAHT